MTNEPTTDDGFDRATLRETANDLTNGLIYQLHNILKQTTQENLKCAQACGQTVLNVKETAAVLRTVHAYTYMASKRLQHIASFMELADDNPEYLDRCVREGPCCDCEVACKHKPTRLYTEREKVLARAAQQRRRSPRSQPQNG